MASLDTLKKRHQFVRIAKCGQKSVKKSLICQVLPQEETGEDIPAIRVGFITSRKLGKATVRNRIKRRLRAAAQEIVLPHGKAGYDYVLVGRKASLQMSFQEILTDLRNALTQLALYVKS